MSHSSEASETPTVQQVLSASSDELVVLIKESMGRLQESLLQQRAREIAYLRQENAKLSADLSSSLGGTDQALKLQGEAWTTPQPPAGASQFQAEHLPASPSQPVPTLPQIVLPEHPSDPAPILSQDLLRDSGSLLSTQALSPRSPRQRSHLNVPEASTSSPMVSFSSGRGAKHGLNVPEQKRGSVLSLASSEVQARGTSSICSGSSGCHSKNSSFVVEESTLVGACRTMDVDKSFTPNMSKQPTIMASMGRAATSALTTMFRRRPVAKPGGGLFPDLDEIKKALMEQIKKKEYNVCDFYHKEGCSQTVARSSWFEQLTLFVIAFNALWIAVDADLNTAVSMNDADAIFQIAAHGFCLYFAWEWVMRFLSFQRKKDGMKDFWFIFDSALLAMMVMDTWIMPALMVLLNPGGGSEGMGNIGVLKIVRLARLTRMARMAKILRAIPELVILVKGIATAARSVFFTLVLLLILMYFFAIVFRLMLDGSETGALYFPSVPDAIVSLMLDAILPDQAGIVRDCAAEHAFYGVMVLVFILLGSLTIMNMLIGVLCELVSVVSAVEKEELTVSYVKTKMQDVWATLDEDGNDFLDKSEFRRLLLMPEAAKTIHGVGVDVIGLVDTIEFAFKDEHHRLSFRDLMELMLSLRGSNQSTVKDIVQLREVVMRELSETRSFILKEVNESVQKTAAATQPPCETEQKLHSGLHKRSCSSEDSGRFDSSW